MYWIIGALWGAFAITRQRELYPESSTLRIIYVALMNCVAWPLCMLIVLVKAVLGLPV